MAIASIETHPFSPFVPPHLRYLLIGSFPGREQTAGNLGEDAWFYGATRNQLWKILSEVYERKLTMKNEKQQLFTELGIGVTDIIKRCIRKSSNNLDQNLEIIEYNIGAIEHILETYKPEKIFFTSRFVEKEFKNYFPDIPIPKRFHRLHHAILN